MGNEQSYLPLLKKSQIDNYQATSDKNLFFNRKNQQYLLIRQYPITVKPQITNYYINRKKMFKNNNEFNNIITLYQFYTDEQFSSLPNFLCTSSPFITNRKNLKNNILFIYQHQPSRLEHQILNRYNFPFEQKQIWSVLCSCIMAAYDLVKSGFKEPILSPNAIMINNQGFIKVGQWQFVNVQDNSQQGQIILTDNLNHKNSILMNYYWAPQGYGVIEETTNIGKRNSQRKLFRKSQIFSLGMTILHMLIRKPLYQIQTFSEKHIQKLLIMAQNQRVKQNLPISDQLKNLLTKMLRWQHEDRIDYQSIYNFIFKIYEKDKQQNWNKNQNRNLTMTLQVDGSGSIEQGYGDCDHPTDDEFQNLRCCQNLQVDYEQQPDTKLIFQNNFDIGIPDESQLEKNSSLKIDCGERPDMYIIQQPYSTKNKQKQIKLQNNKLSFQINNPHKNQQYQQTQKKCSNLFTDPKLLKLIKQNKIITSPLSQITNQLSMKQIPPFQNQQSEWPSFKNSSIEMNSKYQFNNQTVKQSFAKGYYQGNKSNKMRNGYGVFYYNEGGRYQGFWLNDQMNGKGILYYPNDKIAYEGQWCQDQLHGYGQLYNEHYIELGQKCYDYKSFDECQQYWVSYKGNFYHDDKNGFGILTLSNGERYEGIFQKDMIDGVGLFYDKSGRIIHGKWKQNILVEIIKIQNTI